MRNRFIALGFGETRDWDAISDHTPAGDHAIAVAVGVFFNTWGARTFMPWATFIRITDEAYGLLSRQNWLGVPGFSPNGEEFDFPPAEVRAA
ncbi:hypothetical protein [Gluconobacter sp.]